MIDAGSLPSVLMGGFLKGVPPGDLEKCNSMIVTVLNKY